MAIIVQIRGENDASAPLKDVADDVRGVGTAADESKAKGTGFFGGMLQTAGGFLAANVVGQVAGALGGMFTGAISDARMTEQLMGQTNAVIASTGGAAGVSAQQVADYAAALSDASGKSLFGDDQIQESTNLLLTFTNIKGKALDAATAMSVDMAQALGGAPKDSAIQLGKALNDPIAGISALSRVGVSFTEEQKAQIRAMQEAGDMAGAQGVILAELNKEFGGSAEAAAKASGGWAEMQGRLGELAEGLAAKALPIFTTFVGFILDTLMPPLETYLPQAFDLIAGAIGTVVGWFQSAGTESDTLGSVLNDLGGIWETLQGVIANVAAGYQMIIEAVLPIVQQFIADHGAEISAFFKGAWDQIVSIINIALAIYNAVVPPILQAIAGFIKEHGAEIQALLTNTWTFISNIIDAALTLIQGLLKTALQLIQGDWSGAWETVKETLGSVWDNIKTAMGAALDSLKLVIGGVLTWIKDEWGKLVGWALDIGKNIIQGIIDGVSGGIGALEDAVRNAASQALQAAKDFLGIKSPSKVFEEAIGRQMSAGMARGVVSGRSEVDAALADVSRGLARSAGNRAAAGQPGRAEVELSLNAKGLGWLKELVRVEVAGANKRTANSADVRLRTQNYGAS